MFSFANFFSNFWKRWRLVNANESSDLFSQFYTSLSIAGVQMSNLKPLSLSIEFVKSFRERVLLI